MVASSYPRFDGRFGRQLHGADRPGHRRARARGASGRAVASEMEPAEDRSRRSLPSLPLRADAGAEHVRLCRRACAPMSGCARRRSPSRRWRCLAGWFKALRVAQKKRATIMHAHWVIPGGVIGAAAAGVGSAGHQPSRIGRVRRRAASARAARRTRRLQTRALGHRVQRGSALPRRRDRRRRPAIECHSLWRRQRAFQARARTRGRAAENCSASRIMYRWSSPSAVSSRKRDSNI